MQLAVVLMIQLVFWTSSANCLVLVFCLVGLQLPDATAVNSETGKVMDAANISNREWDVAAGFLVTARILIRRLQGRVLDQRKGCRHYWHQKLQFQSAENLRNPAPQAEESLNRTCRIDSRQSKPRSTNPSTCNVDTACNVLHSSFHVQIFTRPVSTGFVKFIWRARSGGWRLWKICGGKLSICTWCGRAKRITSKFLWLAWLSSFNITGSVTVQLTLLRNSFSHFRNPSLTIHPFVWA
jgi:hypothetical protein